MLAPLPRSPPVKRERQGCLQKKGATASKKKNRWNLNVYSRGEEAEDSHGEGCRGDDIVDPESLGE